MYTTVTKNPLKLVFSTHIDTRLSYPWAPQCVCVYVHFSWWRKIQTHIHPVSKYTLCATERWACCYSGSGRALHTKIPLNFSEFSVFDQMYSKIGYRHSRMHSIPTDLLTVYSTEPILNPTVYFRNLRLFDADQRLANNQTTCPATTSLQIFLDLIDPTPTDTWSNVIPPAWNPVLWTQPKLEL